MNLVAAQFFSVIVFLSTSGSDVNEATCAALAVMLHYFLLSVFFWNNVIAFDVWRTFGQGISFIILYRLMRRFLLRIPLGLCTAPVYGTCNCWGLVRQDSRFICQLLVRQMPSASHIICETHSHCSHSWKTARSNPQPLVHQSNSLDSILLYTSRALNYDIRLIQATIAVITAIHTSPNF